MAGLDYMKCAVCAKRVYYDADIDYADAKIVMAICTACSEEWYLHPTKIGRRRRNESKTKKS